MSDQIDLDRIPYLRDLEADLVAAARRTPELTPGPSRPSIRPLLAVAAAILVVVLGTGLLGGRSSRPAAALRFEVTDHDITIRVVDADATPTRIESELAAAGIPAEVQRAFAPPSLDGRLVAVGVIGTGDVRVDDLDDDGTVDQIVLERGFSAALEIVIGDATADPTTAIAVTGPPSDCENLIDRPVAEVADQLTAVSSRIVWARSIPDGEDIDHGRVDARDDIPDDDVVIELTIDGSGTLYVTTTPEPDAIVFPFPESRCR